jgi:hypothetical protein
MAQFTSDYVDNGMIIMLREHRVFLEQRALQHNVYQRQYVYAYEGMFLVAEDTYHELFCQLLYLATTDKLASDFKDFLEHLKAFTDVVRTYSAAVYTNEELKDMV